MGQASSMGSLLLAAGEPGQRRTLPNSTIMMHQPSGGAQGPAVDIQIRSDQIIKTRERLSKIYAHHCNRPVDYIESCLDRDFYLTAQEALAFGLVDEVLTTRHEDEAAAGAAGSGAPLQDPSFGRSF